MKGWLCLNPLKMQLPDGTPLKPPADALAMLGVFKTKKAGRVVFGPYAQFLEVDVPIKKEKIDV